MSTLLWIVIAVAVIFLIIGGTVKAVNFLLWIAPILLIVAVVMFLHEPFPRTARGLTTRLGFAATPRTAAVGGDLVCIEY